MGKQYIKRLIRALLPGKYKCMPKRTRSEVKDYGTYRRKTRKQEREEREREKELEKERREVRKMEEADKKRIKESDKQSEDETKRRKKDPKRKKDDEKLKVEESEKEPVKRKGERKRKEAKQIKEDEKEQFGENEKPSKKKKKKKKADEEIQIEDSDKSDEEETETERRLSQEASTLNGNEKKKIAGSDKEKPYDVDFKIADVVDNGYPSGPIIVVLQKNKVYKRANNDYYGQGSDKTRGSKYYDRETGATTSRDAREFDTDCGSNKCPVTKLRKKESNKPVTKEDLKRFEKLVMEYLEDSNTTIYSCNKQCRKRQESGQSSRVEIAAQSWVNTPTWDAQYREGSIATLNQNCFKQDELSKPDGYWKLTESRDSHVYERNRNSTELISIAEYWEFVSNTNMTEYDNESRGTSIILDENCQQNEPNLTNCHAADLNEGQLTNTEETLPHYQQRQLPIWSKAKYYRIETPAGALKQTNFPAGEFYRFDVPVCISKDKCQCCRQYEMRKQGADVSNFAKVDKTEIKTGMNPKCLEYCTCMYMLDKANID